MVRWRLNTQDATVVPIKPYQAPYFDRSFLGGQLQECNYIRKWTGMLEQEIFLVEANTLNDYENISTHLSYICVMM